MAKNSQKSRWPIALGILLLLVVAGVGTYFALDRLGIVNQDDTDSVATEPATNTEQTPADATPTDAEDETVTEPDEEIILNAVNGFAATGTATRTLDPYVHTVTATLPVPPSDKFYEGWLVSDSGFVSTGKLTQNADDEWTLEYRSEQDRTDYTKVVITEETLANGLDDISETHVLEGAF